MRTVSTRSSRTWRAGSAPAAITCWLPNLYYRAGRDTIYGPDVQEEGSAEHSRMRAVRTKMTIAHLC